MTQLLIRLLFICPKCGGKLLYNPEWPIPPKVACPFCGLEAELTKTQTKTQT